VKIVRTILQIALGLLVALALIFSYSTPDGWKANGGFISFLIFLIMLLGPWWPSSYKRGQSKLDPHSENSKEKEAQQNGEHMLPPTVGPQFRIAFYVSIAITSVIVAFGIPWTSSPPWVALSTWAAVVVVLSLPYIGLHTLLKRSGQFPRFQFVAFIVVVGPILILLVAFQLFAAKHAGSSPMGGWEYVLFPLVQWGLRDLLTLVLKLLEAYEGKKCARHIP
jgi:hypothetical protein